MRKLLAVCVLSLLFACPPAVAPKCEVDSGTTPVDASEPDYEVQFRFVNLGREAVTVQLEGNDGGEKVSPLDSLLKTGHVTLIKQRGSVEARNFLADGGKEPVNLPFDFDTTTGEPVTFVLKDLTPARISMNVTIAKQTQGATFGEKVNAGLVNVDIPGGVNTAGDCNADYSADAGTLARVGLHNDPGEDCPGTADDDFVRPADVDVDATPYFIHGNDSQLEVAWVPRMNAGGTANRLVAAALLGGNRSAPTRRLYVLNIHSARMPASVTINGVAVAQNVAPGSLVRVKSSAIASAARVSAGAIVGIAVGSAVSSFSFGELTGPCKPPYLCDFLNDEDTLIVVSDNPDSSVSVMKSIHDSRKSILGIVRREIAFGTTSSIESNACVAVFPQDDTCVMGAAVVSSVGGGFAPAAAASYAATGRLLYPPQSPPAGVPMRFSVQEIGVVARRFDWSNPPGLTPKAGATPPGGFAIVTSGTVLDPTAVDKRALFFVETGSSPWTVQSSLSK